MKLTTLILLVGLAQVSAKGYGQKINLDERNVRLEKVLETINIQSGYHFFYDEKDLPQKRISIRLKDASIEYALGACFKDFALTYKIVGKNVILKQKEPDDPAMLRQVAVIMITGKVTDEKNIGLPNVNIVNNRTKAVTQSQKDGSYSINAERGDVLVFSFVGYQSKQVTVADGSVYNVSLLFANAALEQVVVVGYGTVKRKDLTGSVASINIAEVKDVPFATIDQALSGKAAGVQVVQADGSPGGVAKIRIRGGTSLLGGNDPLYIIDGVQMQIQNRYLQSAAEIVSPVESYGGDNASQTISGSFARGLNSLGGLNINDIETIDILKDASATAIYGSRAANGVVIITTKKGLRNQKPVFEANYYTGVSSPIKEKLLDRNQYIMIMKEGAQNLNNTRAAATPALAPDATATSILTNPDFLGTANTDWLDLVLRTGITQNADISVRGGGTGSRYYTSLAYNKNNGTIRGTDYNRIAGKVSLDNEINSRLRINTNLDYGFSTNNITNGMYSQALFAPPTVDAYNPDGSIKIISPSANGTYGFEGFQNPLLLLKGINKSNNVSLIGSLAAEYDILKNLKFRSTVSVNFNNYRQTNYVPSTAQVSGAGGFPTGSKNGVATQGQSQSVNTFYENQITWDKEFNENNRINVLAGTSWQLTRSSAFSAAGQGFPDDDYLNNLSSAALTLPSTGTSAQNSLLSFYMRANYALYEKYLFTFTGRSDASSKFPEGNRVGYFPSGGIAWRISQENFLKNVEWIDEIKLRASAGSTGTQNIGDNLFYTLYSPVSYAGLNGLAPSQLGNDKIRWETTRQKDAGIDFAFFKSKLSGGIGYYEKSTKGVLFPATVARSSGFTGVTANIADIRNRGLELSLQGEFLRLKNFQWSGTLNISGNRSKVLSLSNDFSDPSNPKVYRYGNTALQVGQPLGLLYGYQFDGLLRTAEEVADYKSKNLYAQSGFYPYLGIGDARYMLDPATRFNKYDIVGRAEPKYYGGYTNTLTYKNFSLITLATFSYGGDVFYLADIQNADVGARTNKGIRILDRWTPEHQDTERPRLILGQGNNPQYAASNNVYDASFIRLKSLTLNYQFSPALMNKLKMNSAAVYISATNLFTITNYPGADPEVSNDPYSLIGGYSDSGGYPTVKQFSFGLRFGF
ncbi:SusC/RagA family TonB-linked outer membrane protein [Pedobacter frigoris]|uniref:SusC/RagA family TonB-linked outer membrane protein n=1 Tax=Pedobacter frigoris TaxID=2571272 RepID=A0A4U1CK92_9SPHI|nr:SusC/RagA family TonB-linked outer membrane protein [Pedobacter frigoris]TKC07046.1 SusC/RagA family TonB-linked outer membrane protein [Pedobacter frigoris]